MRTLLKCLGLFLCTFFQLAEVFAVKNSPLAEHHQASIPSSPEALMGITPAGPIEPALGSRELMEYYLFVDHRTGKNKIEIRIPFRTVPIYDETVPDDAADPEDIIAPIDQQLDFSEKLFYETIGVWTVDDPSDLQYLQAAFEFFIDPSDDTKHLCRYRQNS